MNDCRGGKRLFNRTAIGRYADLMKEGHVEVRLADKSERAVAVDLLVREWGDPIVVRSQFYPIDECDIYIAGVFFRTCGCVWPR